MLLKLRRKLNTSINRPMTESEGIKHTKMKWIDTNKELPNFDFEVLTCDKRGNVSTLWYRCNENDYRYWGDWEDREHSNITHWMPLPLPPKSVGRKMFNTRN